MTAVPAADDAAAADTSDSTGTAKKPGPKKPGSKKPGPQKSAAKRAAKKSTANKATNTSTASASKKRATKKSAPTTSTAPRSDATDHSALGEPDNDDSSPTNPFGLPFNLGGPPPDLASLGEFIRTQRERAELSVRRLAELADVSNPYLSQVERGLRKPSADILQQVANALRISVESLYVRAGILPEEKRDVSTIPEAIDHDPHLTDDQKRALRGVYDSFVAGS